MEKIKKVSKVLFIIAVLIIMIGAIVVATAGFKFGLMYEEHSRIEVYIEKEYNVDDVTNIIKEVLGEGKVISQEVETFNNDMSFTVSNISEEQAKTLTAKINEKYEMAESTESIIVIDEPHTKMSDIMKPYVMPLVISTVVVVVYLMIRFRKEGALNVALFSILAVTILQALYYSIIAICRIPVSKITMPLSLLVYLITVSWVVIVLGKAERRGKE